MLSSSERHRREVYKQIERQEKQKAASARRARRSEANSRAKLDTDGNRLVDSCSLCGAKNVHCYKHRTNVCVDCGRLYERWRKAKRKGVQSELRLLKPELLRRMDKLCSQDKWAIQGIQNFYDSVKKEDISMKEVTHKICKQCGRDLPIASFRKYVPRGRGIYATTQGHHTLCRDCESISQRVANLQKKKQALTEADKRTLEQAKTMYSTLQSRGLPPVTAAAKRLMGVSVDEDIQNNAMESLMQAILVGTPAVPFEVTEHCKMLRERSYASIDEADQRHRALNQALLDSGKYEEATELLDEWWDEED